MVAPVDLASEEEWRTCPQRKNSGPEYRRRTKDWTIAEEIVEFIQIQEASSPISLIRWCPDQQFLIWFVLLDHDGDRREDFVSVQADDMVELAGDPLLTPFNQMKPRWNWPNTASETNKSSSTFFWLQNKQKQHLMDIYPDKRPTFQLSKPVSPVTGQLVKLTMLSSRQCANCSYATS